MPVIDTINADEQDRARRRPENALGNACSRDPLDPTAPADGHCNQVSLPSAYVVKYDPARRGRLYVADDGTVVRGVLRGEGLQMLLHLPPRLPGFPNRLAIRAE